MTHPPSPEEFYDATIADAWRLACCLHGAGERAEDAVVTAFVEVAHAWPRDVVEGRVRVLAAMSRAAGPRPGTAPAA